LGGWATSYKTTFREDEHPAIASVLILKPKGCGTPGTGKILINSPMTYQKMGGISM
jgi:hypothetical protein